MKNKPKMPLKISKYDFLTLMGKISKSAEISEPKKFFKKVIALNKLIPNFWWNRPPRPRDMEESSILLEILVKKDFFQLRVSGRKWPIRPKWKKIRKVDYLKFQKNIYHWGVESIPRNLFWCAVLHLILVRLAYGFS